MANPRATRFVFEIAGNPATTPTKIRQLGAVPFFLMGPDHPLFLLLPDALNTTVLRHSTLLISTFRMRPPV